MFKNAKLYQLINPVFLTETKLENGIFSPCQPHETLGFGFVPPCPDSKLLIHSVGDFDMVCLKMENRKLPSKVVKEALEKKIAGFVDRNRLVKKADRHPNKAERKQIKDDLIFEMLPKVFTTSGLLYGYIDHKAGLIVIDTNSANKAELMISKLRECLGSLPCVPVYVNYDPCFIITNWLKTLKSPNSSFIEGSEYELKGLDSTIKFKKTDVNDVETEIESLIDNGSVVTKLAMQWKDKISFILSADLTISRIKFLNIEPTGETPAERFDSDFALMTGEFSEFFNDLFGLFGGLNEAP